MGENMDGNMGGCLSGGIGEKALIQESPSRPIAAVVSHSSARGSAPRKQPLNQSFSARSIDIVGLRSPAMLDGALGAFGTGRYHENSNERASAVSV
jgi:hypothetical protein